jgi:hypothetical protein
MLGMPQMIVTVVVVGGHHVHQHHFAGDALRVARGREIAREETRATVADGARQLATERGDRSSPRCRACRLRGQCDLEHLVARVSDKTWAKGLRMKSYVLSDALGDRQPDCIG